MAKQVKRVSADDIAATEKRLKTAIPADLKRFYLSPKSGSIRESLDRVDLIRFSSLRDLSVWDGEGIVPREYLPRAWRRAEFLSFGRTCFGDDLLCLLSSQPAKRGTICLTDHEGDQTLVVLGERVNPWVKRLMSFGGIELAVVPGSAGDFSAEQQLLYARDHLRLNPKCKWAASIIRTHGSKAGKSTR